MTGWVGGLAVLLSVEPAGPRRRGEQWLPGLHTDTTSPSPLACSSPIRRHSRDTAAPGAFPPREKVATVFIIPLSPRSRSSPGSVPELVKNNRRQFVSHRWEQS